MALFGKPPEGKPAEPPAPVPPRPAAPPQPAPSASAPAPRPAPAPTGTCVIGAKTVVTGQISGEEDVLVEGRIEGEVHITRDLRVGMNGTVKATVEAASIVVSGEVIGDCTATGRVEIQSSGRLTGNIRAPKIVIAEGAMFRGNSDMTSREARHERMEEKKVVTT